MGYTKAELTAIYDRTSGYCHLCRKKLSFTNYAAGDARGAWEVEHSVPRAAGGTDRMNNLYASCISCNRSKQDGSTRAARAQNGRTRAPSSREERAEQRTTNAVGVGAIGAFLGLVFLGPLAALILGGIGVAVGKSVKVE